MLKKLFYTQKNSQTLLFNNDILLFSKIYSMLFCMFSNILLQ
ncbi:hypothetical protein PMAN_a2973 [Pseudoalteromonas marina]|nr:hypothetical protein PMAN_a2973 [Pseudoalteromonas marina]GAA74318.1 hypothetical protein P20480_0778 [Pseudoalteromonas sp. BSi20480]